MTIKQLIEKYQSDRNYYLTNKYNETYRLDIWHWFDEKLPIELAVDFNLI